MPSPKANDVGVISPEATSSTFCPFVETGRGGAELALAAGATSAKARAAAAPAAAITRLRIIAPPLKRCVVKKRAIPRAGNAVHIAGRAIDHAKKGRYYRA